MQKDVIFNLDITGLNQLHDLIKETDAAKQALELWNAERKKEIKGSKEVIELSVTQTNALGKRTAKYEALNEQLKKHMKHLKDEATGVTAAKKAIAKKKEEEKKAAAARKKQLADEKKEKKRLSDLEKKREKARKAKVAKEKKDAKMRHQALKKEARLREKNAKATKKSVKQLALQGIKMAAVSRALRQIAQFTSESVQQFAEFEKGIKNVLTLLSTEDKGLLRESLWSGSLDIMNKYGLAANDVNKALFNTVSAGVKGGEAIKFLDAASTLAVAGVTDLTSAVTGIVSVMNAYGKSADEATRIAETLFTTQKFGVTTVEELAKSIGVVLPFAAASGISFEELGAAISVTTRTGLDAAKTVTALRAAISQMQKPATESMHLFTKFGIPVGAAEMKLIGFTETMRRLNIAYKENPAFVEQMFGNVRGLTSILAIAGENMDMYNEQLEVYNADTGTASSLQEGLNEQMDSGQMAIDKMTAAWTNFKVNVGDSDAAVNALSNVTRMLNLFNEEDNVLSNWDAFLAIFNDIVTLGLISDTVGVDAAEAYVVKEKSLLEGQRIKKEAERLLRSEDASQVSGMLIKEDGGAADYRRLQLEAKEGTKEQKKRAKELIDLFDQLIKIRNDYNKHWQEELHLGFDGQERAKIESSYVMTMIRNVQTLDDNLIKLAQSDEERLKRLTEGDEERIKRIAATSMAYRKMAQDAKVTAAETKADLSKLLVPSEDNIWTNFFKKPDQAMVTIDGEEKALTKEVITEIEIKMIGADLDMIQKMLDGVVEIPVDINAFSELLDKLGKGEITQATFDAELAEMKTVEATHELGIDNINKLKEKQSALNLRLSKLSIDTTRDEVKQKIKLHQKMFDTLAQMSSSWVNRAHENYMKSNQEEMDALQLKFDNGVISEARYEREREALEKEAFEKTKKRDIALLTISFARELAAIRLNAMSPNVQNVATSGLWGLTQAQTLSAIAAVAYASNLALITSQTMAKGGVVEGPSHAQGGVKFAVGGQVTELEGGEAVINKKSTAMFKNELSAMNVAGGGVKFADGGITKSFTYNNVVNNKKESTFAETLNSMSTKIIDKSFSPPSPITNNVIDYKAMGQAISQNLNIVLPVESLNKTQKKVETIQNSNRY